MGLPFANRKMRRQAAALERKTGGVVVEVAELERMHRMQQLFCAIVKEQGRVRVKKETLDSMQMGDSVKSKDDGGAIVLSFVPAEPPAEEPTP